jgi:hypothetical protein
VLEIGEQGIVGRVQALRLQLGHLGAPLQLLKVRPGLLTLTLQPAVPRVLGRNFPGFAGSLCLGSFRNFLGPLFNLGR